MNIQHLIDKVKQHPRYADVGMILAHNGVVRQTSRDGQKVTGLKVVVDHQRLAAIIAEHEQRPGIVAVYADIAEKDRLNVGDDLMALVVAGDIRERVIATLTDCLNAIKAEVTRKTEFFTD